VVTDSSTKKLRVKCKDPNCEWWLYAKVVDNSWAIMKYPHQHICRTTVTRVDHAQLIAKMIADIIREDVEKNHIITIKQVRANNITSLCVRQSNTSSDCIIYKYIITDKTKKYNKSNLI
jgi:hypothetical protein